VKTQSLAGGGGWPELAGAATAPAVMPVQGGAGNCWVTSSSAALPVCYDFYDPRIAIVRARMASRGRENVRKLLRQELQQPPTGKAVARCLVNAASPCERP
jgi:hypothetical protein